MPTAAARNAASPPMMTISASGPRMRDSIAPRSARGSERSTSATAIAAVTRRRSAPSTCSIIAIGSCAATRRSSSSTAGIDRAASP
ncbi:hypothetical protein [Sphingomonas sp. PP-CE-3G-477]|uniref:hypothetical protein n=1 Tax=Sphingomonas sp. PP-CE-3G-477 TaxID=2135660 RepID=UPI000D367E7D|nr:hypothetical protein [Sphingomonas sp. PP-CE-3G-477]